MDRLVGWLRHYDWGSATALAALRGVEPSGRPEAELWFGSHWSAPATLADGRPLADGDLPFLVKLLAADRPLSLQAHPDAATAAAGYRREEEAGLDRDDPDRCFPDPGPKPELLCAVSRFDALCGYRERDEAREVAAALSVPQDLLGPEEVDGSNVQDPVAAALAGDRSDDVDRVVSAARAAKGAPGPVGQAAGAVLRIADHHPEDPALLLVPLMRRLVLEPGQAVFVGPGVLHAYLDGVALEVMTPCDNVVRGGFTAKHVSPEVLAEVVDGAAVPTVQWPGDGAHRYEVPVDDFAVWRVAGDLDVEVGERTGPDVVVAVEGTTTVGDSLELAPGEAAWVPVDDGPYRLAVDGVAHRVSAGG